MATTKIKDVTDYLESLAPLSLQESYDNAGLLTGRPEWTISGVLVTLDCTEQVVEEAIQKKVNLIIAHHPIIFKGLRKLTGQNYVERTIIKAIQHNIAIYAIHTNLDNVHRGVNHKIAQKIGLQGLTILSPASLTLKKLVTFIPVAHADAVVAALHEAGAGNIGKYEKCSFQTVGQGTFLPTEGAHPHTGTVGQTEIVAEMRVELLLPAHLEHSILAALRMAHPYEEVAYYIQPITNENQEVGAGMLGQLEQPLEPMEFLLRLKKQMHLTTIRHTPLTGQKISKVAVCGGSGSFLLNKALAAGADAFVSADFKYHEFFDADGRLLIADIGHYESEQFTKELLGEVLSEKFATFAINFSETVTNPISYL